jgi:ubiquinone/menaquinone biosynthesis C-methylase UbiE
MMSETTLLNDKVRGYWESEPCGTSPEIVGEFQPFTRAWFDRVEEHRYSVEPYIHSVAQFTRHRGKMLLEVGVGAGTDHLQWARAGAICHGVDLTDAAIEATRKRLVEYGLESDLTRIDAECLPFEDSSFDVVYSWGVIHHSEHPERIIEEIRRVLKPGGRFIGMMYGRHSLVALRVWAKFGLAKGKPWMSLREGVWNHVESIGTKAYTPQELQLLFGTFSSVRTEPILTEYDTRNLPSWVKSLLPRRLGWFITIAATR